MTCTRCSMILSTRLLTDTRDAPSGASAVFRAALYLSIHLSIYLSAGVRRGRPPRARRRPSTPPSTVAGGGGVRDRAAGCAAAALARVPRSWWRRRACARRRPSDLPSTREMLTISRPPPRRCSAACLLGSATRHFSSALFFAYRWLPRDHGACLLLLLLLLLAPRPRPCVIYPMGCRQRAPIGAAARGLWQCSRALCCWP